MTQPEPQFVRRVAGVGSARVIRFAIGMATTFLLSALLGPSGRGDFALAILVPTTLLALGQLGLPSSLSFFAGRGRAGRSLARIALVLGIGASIVLLLGTLLALPALEASVLRNAPGDLVRLALVSLPFQFVASFSGAILVGRQTFFVYNTVLVAQAALTLALVVVFVGVAGLGPAGAVLGNVIVAGAAATASAIAVRRTTRADEPAPPLGLGELARFGARVYPASVTTFFSYRIDIFLLGFLLAGSPSEVTAAIGLYTLGVSLAELTFFVPDSVSTVFFPRVAGSDRRGADAAAPMVSRMTILVMLLGTVLLVPAAVLAVNVLLPRFTDGLAAFAVLIPGVVVLGLAKVLSSYISGLGRPGPVTVAAVVSLVVNVTANLILIPPLGIIGAALASVMSYALNTAILVLIACRLSRRGPIDFLVPTRAEAVRLVEVVRAGWRRVRSGRRPTTGAGAPPGGEPPAAPS